MKKLIHWIGAMALILSPSVALAQSPIVGKSVAAPGGFLPTIAIYCDDGTGHAALCSFASGGGGGGTGDASASNQTTQIARETSIRDQIGALTSPTTGSTNWLLTDVRTALLGTLTVGTHAVTQSGSWSMAISGGSIGNTAFGSNCTVVSGDQAYTVGAAQTCNLTTTGRLKVGLSSAGNITPAAKLATTTTADLTACQYLATLPAWSDTWTGSLTCNASGALRVESLGKQESFKLINANTPSAAVTVAGGDYILSQTCSAYGTVSFQVRGPDGITYQTAISKTASDTTGGTGLALGSFAVVQMTVSGTTGCNAILARVPA